MRASSLMFRVEKCTDPVDQPGFCKPHDEIVNFVKDLTV